MLKWWDKENEKWCYGVGLSNSHFLNLGTKDEIKLYIINRYDEEQTNIDISEVYGVTSYFDGDEIIERLKYALRWLNSLHSDSPKLNLDSFSQDLPDLNQLSGQQLASLIFTNQQNSISEPSLEQHSNFVKYLEYNAPYLKANKNPLRKGRNLAYSILFLVSFLLVVLNLPIQLPLSWPLWIKQIVLIIFWSIIGIIFIQMANFKWTGFQQKRFWDWLQLLIVPLFLALGAFYLNTSSAQKASQLAEERRQQEILKDYFSEMQDLILEKDSSSNSSSGSKLSPETKAIAEALTFTVLNELDGKRKGQVIIYLAKSGLINLSSPKINLAGANLKKIELENLIAPLTAINLSFVDMQKANLENIAFVNSGFVGTNFKDSSLKDVKFLNSDVSITNFQDAKIENVAFAGGTLYNVCYNKKTLENIVNLIINETSFKNKEDFRNNSKDKKIELILANFKTLPKENNKKAQLTLHNDNEKCTVESGLTDFIKDNGTQDKHNGPQDNPPSVQEYEFSWAIIYSAEKKLEKAQLITKDIHRRLPQYKDRNRLFKKENYYVNAIVFKTEKEARSSIKIINDEYEEYILLKDLKKWCTPVWENSYNSTEKYYDCSWDSNKIIEKIKLLAQEKPSP